MSELNRVEPVCERNAVIVRTTCFQFAWLLLGVIAVAALLPDAVRAAEPSPPIVLWPKGAPGENGDIGPEAEVPRNDERKTTRITNISNPTITLFRPTSDKDTGTAVIVCPGGGYNYSSRGGN